MKPKSGSSGDIMNNFRSIIQQQIKQIPRKKQNSHTQEIGILNCSVFIR